MASFINIHVIVDSVTTWEIHIDKHKTTGDLYSAIRRRDEMKGIQLETIVLDGTPILESDSSSLESSGIRHNCTVVLCIKVHGGGGSASTPEQEAPASVQRSNASKPKEEAPASVRWTTAEPCCVTDDDDPEVKRAKMPCGCVVGAEALKKHCEEKVAKGWFRFPCVKCDKIWPNTAVSEALSAASPDSEFESFRRKVTQNYFSGSAAFKKCPFCGAYVRRDPSGQFLNVNWVECSLCTQKKGSRVAFCWNCEKAWTGDRESCGNPGCDGKDPRIKVLQNCEPAKIGYVSVTGVPKCRACVDCGRILEHSGGCKHMTCPCGCEFCFVCLKKKVKVGNGMQWQCGSYSTVCSVAPRQEVIFEFQPMTKP